MDWFDKLADYYEHNNPPQVRVDMLAKVFGQEDPEVMDQAVTDYITEHFHFPQVAELRSYVEAARHKHNSGARRQDWFDDDDILRWERARGTLPTEEESEREIEEARLIVAGKLLI